MRSSEQSIVDSFLPRTPADNDFRVYVCATNASSTRAALRFAARYADGLASEIIVLVPYLVSHAQSADDVRIPASYVGDIYKRLAESVQVRAMVEVVLCHSTATALSAYLPPGALVIVGGRKGRWWPSRAERLAVRLSIEGHHGLFVDNT